MNVVTAECEHPQQRHTVWYWVEDGDPVPAPRSATFDNLDDALQFAQSGVDQEHPALRWVKVFRADNEAYTCARWDAEPLPEPELSAAPLPVARKRWWQR